MMVFILYAHPEPNLSLNGALLACAVDTLESLGHEVRVSDLYAIKSNPVATVEDFSVRRFPDRLQYDCELKFAVAHDVMAADIVEELEKMYWCDPLIVQFPLYWFSMPAIMKGWFDWVFVNSLVYGSGKRFQTAGLAGLWCVMADAYGPMFAEDGLLGSLPTQLCGTYIRGHSFMLVLMYCRRS